MHNVQTGHKDVSTPNQRKSKPHNGKTDKRQPARAVSAFQSQDVTRIYLSEIGKARCPLLLRRE